MKKRILALALSSCMILGMAACGSGGGSSAEPASSEAPAASSESVSSESATAAPTSGDKQTLNLWAIIGTDAKKEMYEMAEKKFEDANPDVDLVVDFYESSPYKTKLVTVMGSGEGPDIFHSWGGGWLEQFVNEGQVVDITDGIKDWQGDLSQLAWDLNKYDDKYYGVPVSISVAAIYYNKPLFDQYGLTPPATMEELDSVAATFMENGVLPFALGNVNKWPGCLHFIYLAMRYGGSEPFNNAYNRANGGSFEDESYIKAGQMIQTMVDNGYFPEGTNGINYDTGGSRMLMYTDRAAMILQTDGFLTNAINEDKDFYDSKLEILAYPAIGGEKGTGKELLGGENALSIATKCQNPEAALEFIRIFATDDEVVSFAANSVGILPPKNGVAIEDRKVQDLANLVAGADYFQNFYDQALPPEMGELHKETTQGIFGKTLSPEDAAKQMEDMAKQMLD